jgi:hypothetical protein
VFEELDELDLGLIDRSPKEVQCSPDDSAALPPVAAQ